MTLDEQLKGRFTEEEVRHIYNKIQEYGVIRADGVVKMFEGKCWIKKTQLKEAKEKWDSEIKEDWPKGYNMLKNEACRMVCLAESIFALYKKEIERLKGER